MRPFALAYLAVLALSVAAVAALVLLGAAHYPAAVPASLPAATEAIGTTPLARLLLQLIVVLLTARGLGAVARRCGQPAVAGEIVAGLLLGPSLLGWLWPSASALLFPAASFDALGMLAQLGVLLFMFLVGLDLDLDAMRAKLRTAVIVSHVSIFVPFALGVGLVLVAYPALTASGVPPVPFQALALFMGIAMSVTAFPVLARILEERGLTDTDIGRNAIACAAIDDVSAWCLLALVVALAQSASPLQALLTAGLTLAFTALMLGWLKPLLARWAAARDARGDHDTLSTTLVLVVLLSSAAATELIGIHALFGAFVAGLAMPRRGALRAQLRERLHAFGSIVLLPLFFALTGLRTELGLLQSGGDLLLCATIIAVAVAGKLGGSYLAARLTGASQHDSLMIGALMNTRGLMELVVLNLGYDLGILSPRVFTMMVIMALVTTLMTGPLLGLIARRRGAADAR